MHRRGLRIDMQYAVDVEKVLKGRIESAAAEFTPGFNFRSPKEVEALYRDHGFTDKMFAYTDPTANKPNGQISFTEKWLETNEIGTKILTVRRLEKARDSFIKPLAVTNNRNGRVHPTLNQSKSDDFGVAGARFSCSAPNLQAFPKRNQEVGEVVRRLVIADDGMLLEEGDAMQQEPRFFAHYSQDAALLHGYRTDPLFSIHKRAADMMFGGQEYDKAKRMAMGILSMMYPKALAGHLRISVGEAKELRNKFLFDAFPDIGKFQDQVVRVYERRGYVKSILGRKARLESTRYAYQGVSRVIQNSGGDHNKTCMLRACQYEDAYPEQVQILLGIHDSIAWQRDPGHSPKELVRLMENVPHEPQFNLSVPIPFEVGSGHSWDVASYGTKIKNKLGWQI